MGDGGKLGTDVGALMAFATRISISPIWDGYFMQARLNEWTNLDYICMLVCRCDLVCDFNVW